ncbi:unnamed protein product, partial [Prorocentrum cordatum]
AREITQHPEILRVTDYLLPSPSSRHDAALRQFIGVEELARAGGDASMSEEPKRGASGGQEPRSSTSCVPGRRFLVCRGLWRPRGRDLRRRLSSPGRSSRGPLVNLQGLCERSGPQGMGKGVGVLGAVQTTASEIWEDRG